MEPRDRLPEKALLLGDEESNAPSPKDRHQSPGVRLVAILVGGLLLLLVGLAHVRPGSLRSFSLLGCLKGHHKTPHHSKSDVCLTPACIHASSEFLYNLSPDYQQIDPCTDFEELVCGGWRDRHDLRPDQGDAFTGTIMAESSELLLRHILEAPYPDSSTHSYFSPAQLDPASGSVDKDNFDKLKAAYDACLDEDTIREIGVAPLVEILDEISSRFSVARHPHSADNEDLSETVLYLAKLGVSALVSSGTGADDKDPDTVVVSVSAPYRIGLPAKELYLDEKIVERYETVVSQVISALNLSSIHETADAHALVEFEKKLAAASPDAEDRDDVTKYYNPTSLAEAERLTPQLHLSKILKSLVPSDYDLDRVIVMAPEYLKDLANLLDETSEDTLRAYFLWKAIQAYASYVEADAITPYRRFSNELQGKDPDSKPERWRTCVGHVDDGLGWLLSRFFVETAFSAKAKEFGDRIVSDIKDQFIEKLKATEWMEQEVIDLAIRKVHNIVQKIGYPDKSPNILDPDSLYRYYERVNINSSAFFENAVSMTQLEVAREWSALGKPVDRDQWDMTVPTVNAYYNPPGNEIVFPAGIMQFPVFDVNVPEYVSYGAFGSVSGHELSHAFDSTGRHYDQNGNFTDWWTEKTVANFKERAECFVQQYSNFTVDGADNKPLHVNGRLTLGENIADAGGLSASFAAWKKRAAKSPNQDLPGLDFFTQEQLFFVSYSNWWCGKTRKETAIQRIFTDPHAPKWARILGTMANSREFKESFHCKPKEPVCELW
ncbi:hypothetical protein A1O3_00745 [Capronia epimyces CBS 606.96]|uniref:Endothelin-converting enzyme n=1 Tax=Capronia epimyces CBS 606.96 TaxID=1182542 RepID=W9YR94_9EURO|nr:uncharacterized protein A1O3_00745 [Capronia epimyces CBS 606.96]EXJ92195.1 hypothetical protein A1O3_00745 [Capronia epimyces CBS 606.96]